MDGETKKCRKKFKTMFIVDKTLMQLLFIYDRIG